jgi:xylan 1,4-beta-xylosidase
MNNVATNGSQIAELRDGVTGYRNPVLPGFYPDPSVCRVGDEYFLIASSFTYFPGVPIFRSTNLVDWTQIGNVLGRQSQLDLRRTEGWTSLGVYAPTLRHHGGRFWMITTSLTSDGLRNFFVTTEDPAGPWSEPTLVDIVGIDPDIAWDADGTCWVHCAMGQILRHRIDDTTGAVLSGPVPTWSGTGMQYPEAPHLFEREGAWYLLIAEGGTERGHAVSIARGPSPVGPWESCPHNPIISHRSTDKPIQNTGHADLVEAPDGSWWMVLLGTRPRGTTPKFYVLGRETFLAPVEWIDGWPVVGELALEMEHEPPGVARPAADPVRDDFDAASLHPRWLSIRVPLEDKATLRDRPGWLTLRGGPPLEDCEPVFVGRRQQHLRCRVRACVDARDATEAGLTVWMDDRLHYDVAVADGRVTVRARIGPLVQEVASADAPHAEAVVLAIHIDDDERGQDPDILTLGFDDEHGAFTALASLPGRYLSTEVAAGFTGRVIGMFAVGGTAAFDWFDYEPLHVTTVVG